MEQPDVHLTSDSRCLQVTAPASCAVGVGAAVPPHPCRWFNGRCIDCGRAYGEPRTAGVKGTYGSVPWPESYANVVEGIAERNTSLTDQERGHLMDLARWLRDDDATPGTLAADVPSKGA